MATLPPPDMAPAGPPPAGMMGPEPPPLGEPAGPPMEFAPLDPSMALQQILEGIGALATQLEQQRAALEGIAATAAMMAGGAGMETLDVAAGTEPQAGVQDAPLMDAGEEIIE